MSLAPILPFPWTGQRHQICLEDTFLMKIHFLMYTAMISIDPTESTPLNQSRLLNEISSCRSIDLRSLPEIVDLGPCIIHPQTRQTLQTQILPKYNLCDIPT